jgi:hypothetical protein
MAPEDYGFVGRMGFVRFQTNWQHYYAPFFAEEYVDELEMNSMVVELVETLHDEDRIGTHYGIRNCVAHVIVGFADVSSRVPMNFEPRNNMTFGEWVCHGVLP